MTDAEFLERLAAIVGAAHVLTQEDDKAGYLVEPRDLYRGRALAVVRPGATSEVAAVLALCEATRRPVVPQGGNTGLVGGQIPDGTGRAILLSLARMTRVREVDPTSNTMTIEAGATLASAQDAAAGADRLYPLSLASEGSCTVGGNLSTNAGGTAVIAYGNARDLVLGLEVVLADGRVVSSLGKLRKDNTGYDLKHLFMGAEGTLGVITAAVLKLFPKPRAIETAFIGIASPARALDLLALAQAQAGAGVTTFELIPRVGVDFVLRHAAGSRDPLEAPHAWYVLLELSSTQERGLDETMAAILETALAAGVIDDATTAASSAQRDAFWSLRERLSDVQKNEGGSIKHDVSVPVARVPEFIEAASRVVLEREPDGRIVAFGHVGDGNIHFNVSQPVGGDKAAFLARWEEINAAVHAVVLAMGGSISAEHGIGQLKRDLLPGAKDAVALDVMRAIKRALDPNGIMNPGKVF